LGKYSAAPGTDHSVLDGHGEFGEDRLSDDWFPRHRRPNGPALKRGFCVQVLLVSRSPLSRISHTGIVPGIHTGGQTRRGLVGPMRDGVAGGMAAAIVCWQISLDRAP
jgi:hypothetical protein